MTFDFPQGAFGPAFPGPGNNGQGAWQARPGVVPRGVKRATAYIDANLGAPLTLEDLIAASGGSGRTLFKQFRRFLGLSPIAYLRVQRLERVRDELRRDNVASVTEAAVRWRFTHLGRFAGAYRRRYGEPPSATLRRAREDEPPAHLARPLPVLYRQVDGRLCARHDNGYPYLTTMTQESPATSHLTRQFLAWLAEGERSYAEVMEAWRTNCPRLSVWEDATIAGLVQREKRGDSATIVTLTVRGRAFLDESSRSI